MRKLLSIAAVVFALGCLALTLTGHFWALLLLVVVLGPIAFYNRFFNPKTRQRNYDPDRDCFTCGGWGRLANGHACGTCGGRRTR